MIVILDDILTINECNQLIDIYEKNKDKSHVWGNPNFYPLNFNFIESEFTLNILKKIKSIAQMCNQNIVIDWAEITKWIPKTYMNLHTDDTSDKTILTSIIYLNNNYDGGETYLSEGTVIAPKIGRMVIFDGKKYEHGVNKILNNYRYTLPIWYKSKI
jgi:hypothetical protein